jgi:O-methyltransferase involved in polyketide biosynthesis
VHKTETVAQPDAAAHPAANPHALGPTPDRAQASELVTLQAEFPGYRIWREQIGGRVRYTACRRQPGLQPHTVVTDDLDELRAALEPSRYAALIPFRPETPNIARVYSLLLGRKDHLWADRAAARPVLREYPEIADIAKANRAFQAHAVRHAATQGIDQFIDLGAGLPADPNTHQSARAAAPAARVAYVDYDTVVIAHARALLAIDGQVAVVAADIRDPGAVLTDPALTSVIDMSRPVCILLVSVLHFLPPGEADPAVAAYRQAMAPGSYLVISAGTCTGTDPQLIESLQEAYSGTAPVTGRSQAEIAAWFGALTLTPPGLADVRDWQSDRPSDPLRRPPARGRFLAAIGRKPAAITPLQP